MSAILTKLLVGICLLILFSKAFFKEFKSAESGMLGCNPTTSAVTK